MQIEIKVQDYGIGMNEEDINNLFKPYFKTSDEKSKKLNSKSNGLGLSICNKIAQSLQGKILVTSKLNEGTEFNF